MIEHPNSSTRIIPEPIINILRPFSDDYFLYRRYFTAGNSEREVIWIICREPIGISIDQVAKFRCLNNRKLEKILDNCKPTKDARNSRVFHVCPSGSNYASLLPVPQALVTLSTSESARQGNEN